MPQSSRNLRYNALRRLDFAAVGAFNIVNHAPAEKSVLGWQVTPTFFPLEVSNFPRQDGEGLVPSTTAQVTAMAPETGPSIGSQQGETQEPPLRLLLIICSGCSLELYRKVRVHVFVPEYARKAAIVRNWV